jgi:hypothetical protein
MDTIPTREEFNKLRKDLDALTEEVYKNNFSATQDFNKKSSFTTSLKVPSYTQLPQNCLVGEIAEIGGVLKICSSTNSWSNV